MKKHRKLPNGYGSIVYRADGNRRRPYAIKISRNGRQQVIGYTATYEDGLAMLAAYHQNPAPYISAQITFSEVFRLMMAELSRHIAPTTVANYQAAYAHCHRIHDQRLSGLRTGHLQQVISDARDAGVGYASQKKIRQVIHHCYTYAIKYDIIPATANYSAYIDIDPHKIIYPKQPFCTRQLNRVRTLADAEMALSPWAMAVLMLVYSGVRVSELLRLRKSDVKLRQRYFLVRESKTAAGRNRPVPISRKVLAYWEYWLSQPGSYVISHDGQAMSYSLFRTRYDATMRAARCKHTPHECRHTCATMLHRAGADQYAIKRILGHAGTGITEQVYTHMAIRDLRRAIDLL